MYINKQTTVKAGFIPNSIKSFINKDEGLRHPRKSGLLAWNVPFRKETESKSRRILFKARNNPVWGPARLGPGTSILLTLYTGHGDVFRG